MTEIHASEALLPEGWARDVRVRIGSDGRIASVETGVPTPAGAPRRVLLPAMANLHSHAFQRAMAGMTEYRRAGQDSFWTWRELMYRFLDHLTPEDIEAIAALVQVEMLEAGYASVGEFHYVHHQPGGAPYANLAETSARIAAAARLTGIGLTLLPVLYAHGSADGAPLAGGQLRFGNDPARFLRLVEEAGAALDDLDADARLGIAPHSLRAVTPAELAEAVAAFGDGPIHIHIAEQPKEVAEIESRLGARPVAWLLGNQAVGPRWCLIHATHMQPAETAALAASGAVAGLCPITEANLGDGIFDGAAFVAAGGRFGIGSDSNVRIALAEELRSLEYSQRLRDGARNVLLLGEGSTGEALYSAALAGGAQALARESGAIRQGALADLVALDREHLAFAGLGAGQLLDGWIFAAGDDVVCDVWSAGRHVVTGGRHAARDGVEARFRAALGSLMNRL